MAAASAARLIFRSTASSRRSAAPRIISASRPQAAGSPFCLPTQKPLSARIFRLPIEMSCVSVQSMLPYHSATSSALLTSMLSVAPRSYGWTLEDL